ncbi:MAG: putative ATP-dependent endonuclease of OLD family, partial [Arcobacteraceae bacterium]
MELVYLWVDDYKNIKKQGFNFSPRFECEFKYNELIIIDKEETGESYAKDFFGDNINITAIVGENGSGKSNIIESLISNLMSKSLLIDAEYSVLSFFYNNLDKKVYYKDLNHSGILILNRESLLTDIHCLTKYEIKQKKMPFTFHYNYSLDWINNKENNLNFDELYHKTDDYETPILLQPNKSRRKISIANIDYLATRDMLNFTIQNDIKFNFIENFFIPISCELKYGLLDISKKDDNIFYKKLEQLSIPPWDIEDFRKEAYYYILRKTIDKGKVNKYEFIKDADFKKKLLEDKLEENFDALINYVSRNDFEKLYDNKLEYITRKIEDTYMFLDYIKDMKTEVMGFDLLRGKKNIKDEKELLLALPPYIQVDFFDENDVSFYALSYGQKFIIKFIYSLLSQLKNLDSHANYRDINLLLDEVEQGLHPQWQKKFVNFLIEVLKEKKEYNFNIIIASHSPFILSDLPKENVIFLEQGKQKYPFKDKQT